MLVHSLFDYVKFEWYDSLRQDGPTKFAASCKNVHMTEISDISVERSAGRACSHGVECEGIRRIADNRKGLIQ